MIWRIVSVLFLVIIVSPHSFAVVDREMLESNRCTRIFSYFERKYRIPSHTLHSIALKESGKGHSQHKIRIVWPWTVNVEGQGYFFDTKREAISFVKKQILAGKESIDVGCMQINLKHHPEAFLSLDHAFDPKKNISYGAEFLRSKYDQLGNWHKAIAHYHSATHELGFKYKQDVIKIASTMPEYRDSLKIYTHPRYYNLTKESAVKPNKKYERNINRDTNKSTLAQANFQNRRLAFYNNKKYRSNMMVHVPQYNNANSIKVKR